MTEEHLVGFESAGTDGAPAYEREIEARQPKRVASRVAGKRRRAALKAILKSKRGIRSVKRDEIAEKIREAKTREEKMELAREYHESLLKRDPYVFKKWEHELLLRQNRTALKFKSEKTR